VGGQGLGCRSLVRLEVLLHRIQRRSGLRLVGIQGRLRRRLVRVEVLLYRIERGRCVCLVGLQALVLLRRLSLQGFLEHRGQGGPLLMQGVGARRMLRLDTGELCGMVVERLLRCGPERREGLRMGRALGGQRFGELGMLCGQSLLQLLCATRRLGLVFLESLLQRLQAPLDERCRLSLVRLECLLVPSQ